MGLPESKNTESGFVSRALGILIQAIQDDRISGKYACELMGIPKNSRQAFWSGSYHRTAECLLLLIEKSPDVLLAKQLRDAIPEHPLATPDACKDPRTASLENIGVQLRITQAIDEAVKDRIVTIDEAAPILQDCCIVRAQVDGIQQWLREKTGKPLR